MGEGIQSQDNRHSTLRLLWGWMGWMVLGWCTKVHYHPLGSRATEWLHIGRQTDQQVVVPFYLPSTE